MSKIVKNLKFYSEPVTQEEMEILKEIGKRYTSAKNYFYSRYSGINSLDKLFFYKTEIRDVLLEEYTEAHSKDKHLQIIDKQTGELRGYKKCNFSYPSKEPKNTVLEQLKLPSRYWKTALDEAVGGIKSTWSNVKNRVIRAVYQNSELTDKEKHYICYVLKWNNILQAILTNKPYELPLNRKENISDFSDIDTKRIHSLIKRYVRKYKGKIPHSNKTRSFMLDNDMYSLNGNILSVMTLQNSKRISLKLTSAYMSKYKGNIRIVLDEEKNRVEVHIITRVETEEVTTEKVIGLDKNYTNLFATSEGKEYGLAVGVKLTKETEIINDKTTKKNPYYAKVREYKKELKDCKDVDRRQYLQRKINNIEKNNLGLKKHHEQRNKAKAYLQCIINHEIRRFINEEKPSKVVLEDLIFKSNKKKYSTKKYNRKMSNWCKGLLQTRIEYICDLKGIDVVMINPAYTSQVCYKCGNLGERKFKNFYCKCCNEKIDADINAAKNILARYYDKEINLYTKPSKVLEIIKNRVS